MNKKLLTLFAFATLILSACGKTSSFDDDIVYSKKVEGIDKTILLAKIELASKNYKSLSSYEVSKATNSLNETETITETELTAYSDYFLVSEKKETKKNLHAGTGTERVVEEKKVIFDTGNAKIVEYTEDNDGIDYGFTSYTEETAIAVKEELYTKQIFGYTSKLASLDAYSNEEETRYIFQKTSVSESISAVTWGLETKEFHKVVKSQTVCKLNKDLSVDSYSIFEETQQNRDPSTNEWYESDKVVSSKSVVYSISYGTRKDNGKEKSKYIEMFNNAQLFKDNPTLTFTMKKLDGEAKQNVSPSSYEIEKTGLSSVKIKGRVDLNLGETYNAFGLEAKANILANYNASEAVEKTIKVGLQDMAKYSAEYQTVEDFFVKVPSSVPYINLYFELELKIGAGATLVDSAKLYISSDA